MPASYEAAGASHSDGSTPAPVSPTPQQQQQQQSFGKLTIQQELRETHVSGSVIVSDFGDSYLFYRACE